MIRGSTAWQLGWKQPDLSLRIPFGARWEWETEAQSHSSGIAPEAQPYPSRSCKAKSQHGSWVLPPGAAQTNGSGNQFQSIRHHFKTPNRWFLLAQSRGREVGEGEG